jgi:hypothetical protein
MMKSSGARSTLTLPGALGAAAHWPWSGANVVDV